MLGVPMGRRRSILLCVLLLAALTASGCDLVRTGVIGRVVSVGPAAPKPPYEAKPADFAAIEQLLVRRAAAIRRSDRRAFLATLDPGNAYLRRTQLQMFRNLQDLPLSRISYRSGDFAGSGAAHVRGEDPVVRPDVLEVVQLETVDLRPVGNELELTFVRRQGRWLLGNERDSGGSNGPGTRPWYGARIEVVQRNLLLVLADQGTGAELTELATRAEFHMADLAARLGVPGDRAVLIDATSTGVPTALNSQGAEAAAVAYAAATPDGRRVAGWRIKINPERVSRLLDSDWLLRHELVHFLARGLIQVSPVWVREGLAEYVGLMPFSFGDLQFPPRAAKRLRNARLEIPMSAQWRTDPTVNYTVAHAAVTVLGNLRGITGLKELIAAYARTQRGAAKIDPHADWATGQVLRKVFGFGLPELTKRSRALILATL